MVSACADLPVLRGLARLPEAGVAAILRDKTGVVALFDQLPMVEDENLRGVADGGEAVGNHQHGFVLHQRRQCTHQERFVFGIGEGGRFVKDEDGAVCRMARAMVMRWRSPPERVAPRSPTGVGSLAAGRR